MRTSPRTPGLLALALAAAGCTAPFDPSPGVLRTRELAPPALVAAPANVAGGIAVPAASSPTSPGVRTATGVVSGRLSAPPGIVAAGAGNIVAAGAGNIVAAGAGNIVAAGAGNIVAAGAGNIAPRRLFAAGAGLANATVYATDLAGLPFPGVAPATTDAEGRFRIVGVPLGVTVLLSAKVLTPGGREREMSALVAADAPEVAAELDVASTLVVAAARTDKGLAGVPVASFARAVGEVRAELARGDGAADLLRQGWEEAVELLRGDSEKVDRALEPIAQRRGPRDAVTDVEQASAAGVPEEARVQGGRAERDPEAKRGGSRREAAPEPAAMPVAWPDGAMPAEELLDDERPSLRKKAGDPGGKGASGNDGGVVGSTEPGEGDGATDGGKGQGAGDSGKGAGSTDSVKGSEDGGKGGGATDDGKGGGATASIKGSDDGAKDQGATDGGKGGGSSDSVKGKGSDDGGKRTDSGDVVERSGSGDGDATDTAGGGDASGKGGGKGGPRD